MAVVYSYKGATLGRNKETQQSWCHVQTVCDRAACLWCADCFPAQCRRDTPQPGSSTGADEESVKRPSRHSRDHAFCLCRICIESLCPDVRVCECVCVSSVLLFLYILKHFDLQITSCSVVLFLSLNSFVDHQSARDGFFKDVSGAVSRAFTFEWIKLAWFPIILHSVTPKVKKKIQKKYIKL